MIYEENCFYTVTRKLPGQPLPLSLSQSYHVGKSIISLMTRDLQQVIYETNDIEDTINCIYSSATFTITGYNLLYFFKDLKNGYVIDIKVYEDILENTGITKIEYNLY